MIATIHSIFVYYIISPIGQQYLYFIIRGDTMENNAKVKILIWGTGEEYSLNLINMIGNTLSHEILGGGVIKLLILLA